MTPSRSATKVPGTGRFQLPSAVWSGYNGPDSPVKRGFATNRERTMHDHTDRGLATRDRIVAAAAALVAERGVAAISLDDVRAATRTSKSQLYHYFGGKQGLVEA